MRKFDYSRITKLCQKETARRRGCIEHDKNLHGSKTIPKSRYKAFGYHGNRDVYAIVEIVPVF
jgi:hypothetical protein